MVFTSTIFLVYLAGLLFVYFNLPARFRVLFLLIASYFFYAYWKPEFMLLLVAITAIDFFAGIQIEKSESKQAKFFWLSLSMVGNLGILFFFKYFDFVARQLNSLYAVAVDSGAQPVPILNLILPLGISFHTFQSLSYTIDVYKGEQKAEKSFVNLALFVSFFPQLVAGPIERARDLLTQLKVPRNFSYDDCAHGLLILLYGFFKKVVIADHLAMIVDTYYNQPMTSSRYDLLFATYCFAFQIYYDFSGYTDIARGSGKMLGINMVDNFRAPYAAGSVRDFWRRWHISLTNWFRWYVYQPLANRGWQKWACVLMVFTLSGMWHGANWTFLCWGLLNAALYFVTPEVPRQELQSNTWWHWLKFAGRAFITFNLICLTWVFFRAQNISEAFHILNQISKINPTQALFHVYDFIQLWKVRFVMPILAAWLLLYIDNKYPSTSWIPRLRLQPAMIRWGAYASLTYAILLLGELGAAQFIYFQF